MAQFLPHIRNVLEGIRECKRNLEQEIDNSDKINPASSKDYKLQPAYATKQREEGQYKR